MTKLIAASTGASVQRPSNPLYPFDEYHDPTSYRNFQERLVNHHGQFYPQVGLQCFEDTDEFTLGELAEHDSTLQKLFTDLQEQHKTSGEKYLALSKTVDEDIQGLSNGKDNQGKIKNRYMTGVLNHSDKQNAIDMIKELKANYDKNLIELDALQKEELEAFKKLFVNDNNDFIEAELKVNDQSIDITQENAQKFYEKAEYHLKVAHANQKTLLTQRYNHCLTQVQQAWEDPSLLNSTFIMAEANARQAHKSQPGDQEEYDKYGLPLSDQERMDCKPYSLNHYRSSIEQSLNHEGKFHQTLDQEALKKLGFSQKNRYQSNTMLISFNQTNADDGDKKISAQCYIDANWSNDDKLAAAKAFVTACHAQGLKRFNGIEQLDISHENKIKLIEHIRCLYGTRAVIAGERSILDRNVLKKQGMNQAMQDHCFQLLYNPNIPQTDGTVRPYIELLQEKQGYQHCKQIDKLTDDEFKLLELPNATDIPKPDWATPDQSGQISATPLVPTGADPKSPHAQPASYGPSSSSSSSSSSSPGMSQSPS